LKQAAGFKCKSDTLFDAPKGTCPAKPLLVAATKAREQANGAEGAVKAKAGNGDASTSDNKSSGRSSGGSSDIGMPISGHFVLSLVEPCPNREEEVGVQANRKDAWLNAEKEAMWKAEKDAPLKAENEGAQQKFKERACSMGKEDSWLKLDVTGKNSTDKNCRTW
jgi:hypothetical protein